LQNIPPHDNSPASPPPPSPFNQTGKPNKPRPNWLIILLGILGILVAIELIFIAFITGLPQYLLHHGATSHPISITVAATAPSKQPITPTAAFHAAPCTFKLGDGIIEGKMVKCGYVTVPEDRSLNNGRIVRLALAIFKSPSVKVDPYPVIRLDGGPGGPSLDDWAHYVTAANYNTFVFNHDLVMFDQRGTGYSQPSLNCPEILNLQFSTISQHFSRQQGEKLQVQAAQACHDRLVRMGIDLNAYNTLENAADVRDIIHAIGYQQMTLYGVSYGTRLALTVMRLYPSVIHAVVLDSVYPPQKNRNAVPNAAERVFHVLFQGCAADPNCNRHYPNLENVFYKLVNDLNTKPISFPTTDPATNKNYTASFAGDDLIFWLYSALYVTEFIPQLPQIIFQIRDHNYSQLSQIYGFVEFDDTFSDGLFYSAECSEDWAFLTQQDIAKAIQGVDSPMQPAWASELQTEYDICKLWKVNPLPVTQKQPVTSNIPTLILSGEYDPITPPANGQLTEQTLKNSYYFLFPGMGHGEEYNSDCADSIISNFEDNPNIKPSGVCINNLSEPAFQ
jgi:pimeloyl-ACP methyl ester carboxylesterase